ncbi:PAS domain-containing protein [Massilia sp. PAMC28688]|uniref:methyl-accepting chemotaxis protein n=1 Tax=Massilia sp. PAMC28688 TaxID=2861283 RepID=UPI001C6327AC|nr:PAS domain-containing methyl-accepting chemotaxis protein [Massilia sp. PAMC28688]QYF95229.1 PAS domain-containing protein [Massilia sp. PAMC28688]
MRNNSPVTHKEYVLGDTETVVSKTDLKGNITYVNADFVKISGFSEAELLGSPQNIVRHPDMPAAAFADFWETIKAGKAWTGLVKNRCKNGDHYWVEANAAPIIEGGKMVGFTSVRVKPSRQQVAAAEQAYKKINDGERAIRIREGAVVPARAGLGAWAVETRLSVQVAIATLLMLAAFGLAVFAALQGATVPALLLAAGGTAACLAYGALLMHSVVKPLRQVKQDLDQMSAGDLSGRIRATGSVEMVAMLQGIRVLQTNVKLLVGQIKEAAEVVTRGAGGIAEGTSDLLLRSDEQTSALQQTSSSMEELTGTVGQNAEHAEEANRLASQAAQTAIEGGNAVKQVVDTMQSIRTSSGKVVDIIGVIDSIAFQTNILALNAAVEAARAGDQGRGFAVVATEVRSLAHRSAAAAKEIKTLIGNSVEQVESGGALVESAGSTMRDIVSAVQQVAGFMQEITHASREQKIGIEQVNGAITRMDSATQQNTAIVEDAANAASSMNGQAIKLTELINSFKLVSHSRGGRGMAAAPPAAAQPGRTPALNGPRA